MSSATAELVVAFSAKIEGLEASLKRVTDRISDLESSAKKAKEEVAKISDSGGTGFTRLASSVNNAARAFIALQAVQIVRDNFLGLVRSIDEVNASMIRLRFVMNDSPTIALDTFGRLADISRRTGAPVNDLTDAFVRFRTALNTLGTSNAEVNKLVEGLANFGRVSGARPQEAINAIIQLGQGLASGRLQGDELRSILENMPALATALAEELGVSVGQLREMGEKGELVAERVLPALLRAADSIARRLEGVPLTMSQSFEGLKTSWTQLLEYLDRTTRASTIGSLLLQGMTGRINFVRQALGGLTPGEISGGDANRRNFLQTQIRNLEAEIARGGPDPSQVRDNQGATIQYTRQQMESLRQEANRLREELARIPNSVAQANLDLEDAELGQTYAQLRNRMEGERARAQAVSERAANAVSNGVRRLQEERDKLIRDVRQAASTGNLRDEQDNPIVGQTATDAYVRRIQAAYDRRIKDIEDRVSRDGESAARQASRVQRQAEALRLQTERERERLISTITGGDQRGVRQFESAMRDAMTPAAGSRLGSATDVFIQQIKGRQEEIGTLFGFVARQAEQAGQAMIRNGENIGPLYQSVEQVLQRLGDTLLRELGPERAEEIARALGITIEQLRERLGKLQEKSEKTFEDIGVRATTMFASDIAGGITDMVSGAEVSFNQLAASFLKNVAKMIMEFLILQALVTAFRGMGWNPQGLQGIPSLFGRMAGGPVSAGQPYIVGERRPELFVPSTSGHIYPQVPSGGMNVVVNQNAPGVVVRAQQIDPRTVQLAVSMSREQVLADYRESMRSGYGGFAEPAAAAYNLRRRV